jgi:hypothetical protein
MLLFDRRCPIDDVYFHASAILRWPFIYFVFRSFHRILMWFFGIPYKLLCQQPYC